MPLTAHRESMNSENPRSADITKFSKIGAPMSVNKRYMAMEVKPMSRAAKPGFMIHSRNRTDILAVFNTVAMLAVETTKVLRKNPINKPQIRTLGLASRK